MTDAREAFLAGERHDDVAIYLADDVVDDPERLLSYGERVEGGVVLVLDGETGRNVFEAATGTEAMGFAGTAMKTDGEVDRDLVGGTCPEAESGGDEGAGEAVDGDDEGATEPADGASGEHAARFVLAFAEEENEEVGGRYAEGDVIHAYVQCECGTAYSQNWIAGER